MATHREFIYVKVPDGMPDLGCFRLVEVPAGESIVDFDYAPRSVRFGLLVSTITATALIVYALRAWRGRRR